MSNVWFGGVWLDQSGEANTVSNVGSGVGLFKQKNGVDLEFNCLKSENSLLSITLDSGTNDIEFTVNESSIDHGSLSGLGDDDHTQYLLADGSRGLSADWDAGNHEITIDTITATTGNFGFSDELMTNADFDDGSTGWTVYGVDWSYGNDAGDYYAYTTGTGDYVEQNVIESGKSYKIDVHIINTDYAQLHIAGTLIKTWTGGTFEESIFYTATATGTARLTNVIDLFSPTLKIYKFSVKEYSIFNLGDLRCNELLFNVIESRTAEGTTGDYALSMGFECEASGNYATAIGDGCDATGQSSFAGGRNCVASGISSFSFGQGADATGSLSFAAGYNSQATDTYAVAIGPNANASETGAIAMGLRAVASANYSIALGIDSEVSGLYGVALGYFAKASGQCAVAVGYRSIAAGSHSLAFGDDHTNSVADSLSIGWGEKHFSFTNDALSFIDSDIYFQLEDSASNLDTAGIVDCVWTDNTSGSEDADMILKLMEGGATAAERARLTSDGDFKITNDYYSNGNQGLSGTLTLDDGANWRITLTFTGGILTGQTTGASSSAAATWV